LASSNVDVGLDGVPFAVERRVGCFDEVSAAAREDLSRTVDQRQVRTEEFGIPDISIQTSDLDVLVEVKLGGGLTHLQADAYARALVYRGHTHQVLVALTGFPPLYEMPEGTIVRIWGDLGSQLLHATEHSDPVTQHLVEQLVGLLNSSTSCLSEFAPRSRRR
jgi:hypothetical protein